MADQESKERQAAEVEAHESLLRADDRAAVTLLPDAEQPPLILPTEDASSSGNETASVSAEVADSASQAVALPRRSGYRDERVREGNRLLDRRAVPRGPTAEPGEWERRRSADAPEISPAAQQPAWLNLAADLLEQRPRSERQDSDDPRTSPADLRRVDEV